MQKDFLEKTELIDNSKNPVCHEGPFSVKIRNIKNKHNIFI